MPESTKVQNKYQLSRIEEIKVSVSCYTLHIVWQSMYELSFEHIGDKRGHKLHECVAFSVAAS